MSFIESNMENTGEIVVYEQDETTRLEVRMQAETVWLNRHQIAQLFGRDIKTIGKHINNALKEELSNIPTVANFAIVQEEGTRWVTRYIEHYNLDMIISVGYRVKSQKGVLFRRWANEILKEYLMKGIAINQRIASLENRVEEKFIKYDQVLYDHSKKIDFFVQSSLPPKQGIFFDGQIYDAYAFVADLVRTASRRIILIDNYIDDTVLTMMSKRAAGVEAVIYTGKISKQLRLDIDKHNAQYPPLEVRTFAKAHDRFLIIDDAVYLVGASIKDLGKKWFGFTLMENTDAEELLGKVKMA